MRGGDRSGTVCGSGLGGVSGHTYSELLHEAREELLPLLGEASVAEHASVHAEEVLEVQQVARSCRGDHLPR